MHRRPLLAVAALALATAIGLLMGLERERHPSVKAGVRTFGLTGLLGALVTPLFGWRALADGAAQK